MDSKEKSHLQRTEAPNAFSKLGSQKHPARISQTETLLEQLEQRAAQTREQLRESAAQERAAQQARQNAADCKTQLNKLDKKQLNKHKKLNKDPTLDTLKQLNELDSKQV